MSDIIDKNLPIPDHVGIIMDGNGRWAKKRGLKRTDGHEQGIEAIFDVIKRANRLGIKAVTLYAFSTENWKRPMTEVTFLMKLPNKFLNKYLPELIENNIKVMMTGFSNRIPDYTKEAIKKGIRDTKDNDGLILNIAFNYGGRAEIVQAIKDIVQEVQKGELSPSDISEDTVTKHLLTHQLTPYDDVDFMIRTSGEQRISNFLLWQNAYSEFYFTDVHWPEFDGDAFEEAIAEYQHRQRRFGKV